MKNLSSILFIFLLVVTVINTGCRSSNGSRSAAAPSQPAPQPPPPPPPPPVIPITGTYCTLSADSIYLMCLQANGQWQASGGSPVNQTPTNPPTYSFNPSLSKLANGNLVLAYTESTPDSYKIMLYQYNSTTGWSALSSSNLATALPQGQEPYSQFGGSFFELNNKQYYFWTHYFGGYLSTPSANSWTHIAVEPSLTNFMRHPEVFVAAAPNTAYIHYGEPTPKVWRFNGTALSAVGNLVTNPATEYTLYTAMTEWNGNPVIAYTSSNFKTTNNWFTSTDVTKVYAYNGTTWNQLSAGIQDTPGHDGVKPYLFTQGGNLHIMYADYTTTGVPTEPDQILMRFRVKRWNGTSWQQVGTESDPVYLSQRFEFLNDNGTILVNVIQGAPGGGSQQVVLAWVNGGFGYLGNPVCAWPTTPFKMHPRPGAVIKL